MENTYADSLILSYLLRVCTFYLLLSGAIQILVSAK
jgi:hypothetical protein